MTRQIEVLPATLKDLKYIDYLQRKNAEELAFYPTQVFEREVENFRILLAKVNNTPAGYIYHGAFGNVCKIHQACIEYDLRGQLYGSEMVRYLIQMADVAKVHSIKLRCGSEIQANHFWQTMGFHCESVTVGGIRRMRDINCWRYDLQPVLFMSPINPSNKKKSASVWAKRKTSSKSSFLRGRALKVYREKILQDANKD